jgi:sigma-B regulation protein RsbU (phosphoserine phosphatase)
MLMKLGQVSPFVPYTSSASLVENIPDSQMADGTVLIAVRAHIAPDDWAYSRPGLDDVNLTLGRGNVLSGWVWESKVKGMGPEFVNSLFGFLLSLVALALFFAQRIRREYLWLALQLLVSQLDWIFADILRNVPLHWLVFRNLAFVLTILFQVLMYFAFLRLRFGWIIRIYFLAAASVYIGIGFARDNDPWVTTTFGVFPLMLLPYALIPILLIVHLRRGNREAGILLIPTILGGLAFYLTLTMVILGQIRSLASWSVRLSTFLFSGRIAGFEVMLGDVSVFFYLLSLTVIIVVRSIRMSRAQAIFEGDIDAARQVQQVILPEQIEAVPGFTVEIVYKPAQQVGGDFFQVLPLGDGGLVLVVGDVAGKGLPAAMMVSLLVGAIRSTAEFTKAPGDLLAHLNQRMMGRARGGFSTALAARIDADGLVTIANAGHLPPYLDGLEVELPGALPLGIVGGARYETKQFQLVLGSRLTFYSDGVVEARNTNGELLGFERAMELSTQSAAAIVEAASLFGQEDDITVVTVQRAALIASAA